MSQGQEWNTWGGGQPYQQPSYQQAPAQENPYQQRPADQAYPQAPYGQGYQQAPNGQAYQQPQVQDGYPPAPYQQPYSPAYRAPTGMQVAAKNPGIALLISLFVPGVGSLYAGKTNTGIIILVGFIVSWVLTLVLIGIVGLIGFWVWGLIDAYQAAQSWNRAHGIIS